jgi:hypothetical protein
VAAGATDAARAADGRAAVPDRWAGGRSAVAERLRRALRTTAENQAIGERLPYLLAKLKAPRIRERLLT